jgi:hypothetical protein
MSLNRPTAAELLEAIAEFLARDVTPQVDAATQFQLRVASNVIAILSRELAQRPAADAAEHANLVALLGETGSAETLNARLVERIRAGHFDAPDAERRLLRHLRATTTDKLAIDNPRWAGGGA